LTVYPILIARLPRGLILALFGMGQSRNHILIRVDKNGSPAQPPQSEFVP